MLIMQKLVQLKKEAVWKNNEWNYLVLKVKLFFSEKN